MSNRQDEQHIFEMIFDRGDVGRANFLSRLFGLFSEEVVRIWCAQPAARYEDLGRPTLTEQGKSRGYTLDFLLRERDSGSLFVAELKAKSPSTTSGTCACGTRPS
jgi:hypothetical protein